MPNNPLVEKLAKLGLSNYEARAYVSLLKHHPATGYETAKNSGVPQSKIYEVIARLLDRSIISPLCGKPVRYMPQDSKAFVQNLRNSFSDDLNFLEKHLPEPQTENIDYVWNVRDMQEFILRAKQLIRKARREIIVVCWDQELRQIIEELKVKKGLKIAAIHFGDVEIPVGTVYQHTIPGVMEREKGGRMFSLVTDASNLLQGIFTATGQVSGVYTSHPSLVETAIDYMKHEIYSTKMYNRFTAAMDREFGGKQLGKLRNIWRK